MPQLQRKNLLNPPQTIRQAFENIYLRGQQAKQELIKTGEAHRRMTEIMDKWSRGEATADERKEIISAYMQNAALVGGGVAFHGTPHEWAMKPVSRTAEDFQLSPAKMAGLKYNVVAIKSKGKIISARVGEKFNGQEVWNHADLEVAAGVKPDEVVPGFLDRQGKFVIQYPEQKELLSSVQVSTASKPQLRMEPRPDISKVGTGQGAQSYGHGLYFAENPRTALSYKQNLAGDIPKFIVNGQEKTVKEALELLPKAIGHDVPQELVDFIGKKGESYILIKNMLQKEGHRVKLEYGNLYQVNIPDEHVAKMLDWDKPLSEQPEIMNVVKRLGITPDDIWNSAMPAFKEKAPANFNPTGENFYKHLTRIQPGRGDTSAIASEQLARLGIPGIKYLDQGSRGVTVEPSAGGRWVVKSFGNLVKRVDSQQEAEAIASKMGTRNFVVFDPEIIDKVIKMQ